MRILQGALDAVYACIGLSDPGLVEHELAQGLLLSAAEVEEFLLQHPDAYISAEAPPWLPDFEAYYHISRPRHTPLYKISRSEAIKSAHILELLERWWGMDSNLPRDARKKALVQKLHESYWNDHFSLLPHVRRDFPHLEDEALKWYTERIQHVLKTEIPLRSKDDIHRPWLSRFLRGEVGLL